MDRGRLRQLLERHEGALVRYAARLLGDVERGRDVVQETFLKLWREPPKGDEDDLGPWLFTVCRNLAFDVLRKERRMVLLKDDDALAAKAHEAAGAGGASGTGDAVAAALAGLPANQQEVLRLKFQNGLSYRDISRVTGLSESNVGYLIHMGVKALRRSLAPSETSRAGKVSRKGGLK